MYSGEWFGLARSRPRRALRPPLAVRVGRVVAPIAFFGVLASGVAVAIWPQPEYTAAVPAPAATPTQTPTTSASARVSRDEASRPPVKSSASAKAFRAKPSAKQKPPTFAPSRQGRSQERFADGDGHPVHDDGGQCPHRAKRRRQGDHRALRRQQGLDDQRRRAGMGGDPLRQAAPLGPQRVSVVQEAVHLHAVRHVQRHLLCTL